MTGILKFPIQWIHSDAVLCAQAAEFKAAHSISFADAFVAAAALRVSASSVRQGLCFGQWKGTSG
jgi:hypothetical protein